MLIDASAGESVAAVEIYSAAENELILGTMFSYSTGSTYVIIRTSDGIVVKEFQQWLHIPLDGE